MAEQKKAAKPPVVVEAEGKEVAKPHERTEEETAYMQDFHVRKAAKRKLPKITFEVDGETVRIACSHDDPEIAQALMLDAFGTMDESFMDGLFKQLASAGEHDFDFMLSMVMGIEPKDQIEAMLAVQMAAVHLATMGMVQRLNHAATIEQQNSAERALNKLTRTFTTQMEALNRYRGKGQQKMTVEHVHVHEGGQAIVGNVQGGGGENKTEGQPHAKQVTHAPGAPMPSQDTTGDVVPIPGHEKRKVLAARG